MIEDNFQSDIQHARCRNGLIESSSCCAFKIDDDDGLAAHLDFNNSSLSKVDYFHKNNDQILLIELSDLDNQLSDIQSVLIEAHRNSTTAKEKKEATKKAWSPLTFEFQKKWCGSIAVIERLYRKNELISSNPDYQLLIVCKNGTDIRLLDGLCSRLEGMIKSVKICKTEDISDYLI